MTAPLIKLGTLHTLPLDSTGAGKEKEEIEGIGYFELDVTLARSIFLASGDKPGLVKSTIGTWLASAILDTEVPREYWNFKTHRLIAKEFNLPRQMSFKI